jgi:hypothetical protein
MLRFIPCTTKKSGARLLKLSGRPIFLDVTPQGKRLAAARQPASGRIIFMIF